MFKFTATGYIIFENKILLIKHPKIGKWMPVGGKLHEKESPINCVKREIFEEVGIKKFKFLGEFENDSEKILLSSLKIQHYLTQKLNILDFIYVVESENGKVKLEDKIKEYKFFSYEEFLKIENEIFPEVFIPGKNIFETYIKNQDYKEVIDFWFLETPGEKRFNGGEKLDKEIKDKFIEIYFEVLNGEKENSWRQTPKGRLAEIIVLDQFARNIFRGKREAFQGDFLALSLAQESIRKGDEMYFSEEEKQFLYMPFMHSESKEIHKIAEKLFGKDHIWEQKHKEIIDKFGRYPHRNRILGRESTNEELEFLKTNHGF